MSNINNRPPTMESGLYHGARHNDPVTGAPLGGIRTIIDNTKVIEIEGGEYFICRDAMNSSEVFSFKSKTNKQILDKLFREEGCRFQQGVGKSGDFIVCRLVVLDDKPRDISGTPKQIINKLQSEKACKMSNDATQKKLGGVFKETTPEELEARWSKKRESIETLSNNIQKLRNNVSRDLKSENEKIALTSLVVAIIDKTAERIGNSVSEKIKHVGVTGFKKNHVVIIGNKIHLEYIGKSGVEHIKSFSDERIAKLLKKAIKNSPSKRVFTTSDGFDIKADRVNRYLSDFGVSAKDLRGYASNRWMIDKLKNQDIPEKESDRKKLYLKTLRSVAEKVGHGFATLRKHYVIPQLELKYVDDKQIIDISDRATYEDGGNLDCGCKHEEGGELKSELLAPNGKKSNLNKLQYNLVRTPEFKRWFGDWENDPKNSSKVIDKNGEPLIVYHGAVEKFNIFDRSKLGSFTYKNTTVPLTGGFFFSDDYNNALSYIKREGQPIKQKFKQFISGHIKSCFLNIKEIYVADGNEKWDCVFKNGKECFSTDDISRSVYTLMDNDGILFKNIIDTGNKNISEKKCNIYVAFESNQIKLADGTNISFDDNKSDIRFNNGGEIISEPEELKKLKTQKSKLQIKAFPSSPIQKKIIAEIDVLTEKINKLENKKELKSGGELKSEKAHLMTKEDYIANVVPLLKEYKVFIKKNNKYFKHLSGLMYYSYPEIVEAMDNKEDLGVYPFNFSKDLEYYKNNQQKLDEGWASSNYRGDSGGSEKDVPSGILERNIDYREKLSNIFEQKFYRSSSSIESENLKSNKRAIKFALDYGEYERLLKEDKVTTAELEKYALSNEVKLPKRLYKDSDIVKKKIENDLLNSIPSINKDALEKLIVDLKKSFEPMSKIIFDDEKAKMITLIDKAQKESKVYQDSIYFQNIQFFYVFNTSQPHKENFKGTKGQIITRTYYTDISLKPEWEAAVDKDIDSYVEMLKWQFMGAIIEKFNKINLPISSFEQASINVGKKGFEGMYTFHFENGSFFTFHTEAVSAGGYNIQRYHFRYLISFIGIKLSDGTIIHTMDYPDIVKNFSDAKELNVFTVIEKSGTYEGITKAVFDYLKSKSYEFKNVRLSKDKEGEYISYKEADSRKFGGSYFSVRKEATLESAKEKASKFLLKNGAKQVEQLESGGDLENPEKSSIFISDLINNKIQHDISGISKIRSGTIIQATSNYLKNSQRTSSEVKGSKHFKKQEAESLKSYVAQNNLWVSEKEFKNYISQGAEQKVYLVDKKYVIKTNDSIFYNSWIDYLHSLLLHNYFFPATAYELIGFKEDNNVLLAVVRQPFVQETEKTDLESVKKFMADNGFVNTKGNDYYNPELGIILEDLHDENVLTENGVLQFVDTVFYIAPDKKLKNGGEISIESASNRFRPYETIVFEKPIIGVNGAELISYKWAYEWQEDFNEKIGEGVSKRISDWSQAEISADTGKSIVHQFNVKMPDGKIETVSSESVLVLLGYTKRETLKSFPSLVTDLKTLSKQRLQLAIMEAQEKEFLDFKNKLERGEKPEIKEVPEPIESEWLQKDWKEGKWVVYGMGDSWRRQDNIYDYDSKKHLVRPITKDTIEQLTYQWVNDQLKQAGVKHPNGIYDLRNRVKRQEKKVEELTGRVEIKMGDGGEFENSENKTNFVINTTKDELRNVISGTNKVVNGNIIQTASSYIRTSEKTSGESGKTMLESACIYISRGIRTAEEKQSRSLSINEIKDIEARLSYEFAKKNNIWIEDFYVLGKPLIGGGNENTLWYDEKQILIYKSNNLFNHDFSILNYLKYVTYHNTLFKQNPYNFIGFNGIYKGDAVPYIEPVVSQEYIDGAIITTEREIENYMQSIGFEKINDHSFENDSFLISDLRPRNVLKDKDGKIHVIDNIIKNKKFAQSRGINPNNIRFNSGGDIDSKLYDSDLQPYFKHAVDRKVNTNQILFDRSQVLNGGLEELVSSLPEETIPLDKIVPTQSGFSSERLNRLQGKQTDLPLFVKIGDLYYVEDGHHRILDKIMNNLPITGKVFHMDAVNNSVTAENYYDNTTADFKLLVGNKHDAEKELKEIIRNNGLKYYISKGGSIYAIKNNVVYRFSDHWGQLDSCKWNLFDESGKELSPDNFVLASCSLDSFQQNMNTTMAQGGEITSWKSDIGKMYDGQLSVEEYKKSYDNLVSKKDEIIVNLSTMKKDELLSIMGSQGQARYKNEKKDRVILAVWDDMISSYALGMISWSMNEKMSDVIKRKVDAVTEDELKKFAEEVAQSREERKQRIIAYKKALTNPETLEEFKIFVREYGKEKLTPEQLISYDDLVSGTTKEHRDAELLKKAEIQAVQLGSISMNLIETEHTRDKYPLFVVKLTGRVDGDVFKDLSVKAKRLSGWYSSFTKNGAIAGFQFKEKEQAEKFMSLQQGSVSNIDKVVERKETRKSEVAEKLRELGQKTIDKANEELGRERLTNTYKRATQAGHSDARAYESKRIGETMINISEEIANGEAKHLEGIKSKTHIELLDSLVNSARYKETQAKAKSQRDYDAMKGAPATIETINYSPATLYPNLYKGNLLSLIREVSWKEGVKLIANRLEKRLKGVADDGYYNPRSEDEMEDIEKMLLLSKDFGSTTLKRQVDDYKRMKSMGLDNDSMIRSALREYITYRAGLGTVDKVKELERKAVGKKLGFDFFPTPKNTAIEMVEMADIEDGMDILEPSAGNGNIAEIIIDRHPNVNLDVIEISSDLRDIIEAKGFNVVAHDFLDYNEKKYDRIIMNPPFSNSNDIIHVQHAYSLLKSNGIIVAIMGVGAFFRSDKKAVEFREWIEKLGAEVEDLPENTFMDKTLLNTTGAGAKLVKIRMTDVAESAEMSSEDYRSALEGATAMLDFTEGQEKQDLQDYIESLNTMISIN